MGSFPDTWTPRMLSVLRVVTGLLFMQHGAQKLFGALEGRGPVPLATLQGAAGVIEFFGGGLIVLGLLTRGVAFLCSGTMAVAYFMSHAPRGFWPILNRGELASLFCFVFLFFSVAGAGPWSLDSLWTAYRDRRRGRRGVD